jgi:hypothetical protein
VGLASGSSRDIAIHDGDDAAGLGLLEDLDRNAEFFAKRP